MIIHFTAKGLYVSGVLMEKHHTKNAIAEHIKFMLFK
jgi:hypothetical protein